MEDPLLSSLCTICRINIPRYTCPKCSVQTCSLSCSRRHKLWSECSGIRDPTVFKPRSELCTPSGIDHDYNFLHSIETRIERSEKEIIERRLVKKSELKGQAKEQPRHNRKRKRGSEPNRYEGLTPSEVHIDKCLSIMGIRVERAPQGIKRRTENTTNYSKPQKSINWQVEWFRDGDRERLLTKAMGNKPIGLIWKDILEEDRRNQMTPEERVALKKAVSKERDSAVKKLKRDQLEALKHPIVATSSLQNSWTTAWGLTSCPLSNKEQLAEPPEPDNAKFFLVRPFTPASMPKILVPLDSSRTLNDQLRKRAVLEYPTIYVFKHNASIPKGFMLEKAFMIKTGETTPDTDDNSSDSSSESKDSNDTSSSGSDASTEEGEISE
ncbi:hypothetical protein BJ875DRAFT_449085 [Amylocarpus encephaloides]|uniref:Box C/D snoRNA protein 1 n=1 Tax=Amylocarpus encephaloides TaxID=45428 RepID=A0A9P7YU82_9HELO|nr:hypothetical protein BJ875DRAFT_449085 [Amylocarpus encephaloides]